MTQNKRDVINQIMALLKSLSKYVSAQDLVNEGYALDKKTLLNKMQKLLEQVISDECNYYL